MMQESVHISTAYAGLLMAEFKDTEREGRDREQSTKTLSYAINLRALPSGKRQIKRVFNDSACSQ